jgi:hypothetical protein
LIRRSVVLFIVAALALVACGGGKKKAAAKVDPTTSSAPTIPTTTTTTAPPVFPLTGVLATDAARLKRVALIVKIDNSNAARPQSGLNEADIVVEEEVEGGITRLAAIFQSGDSSPVGPVRSARSTDIAVASELNHPLFAYSGANQIFLDQVRAAPLVDVGADAAGGEYRRDNKRSAPDNLYSDTTKLFGHAPPDAGPPPQLFTYRPAGQPATGAAIAPLTHVGVTFTGGGTRVTWDWDAASGTWKRGMNGTVHADAAGKQVSPKNVVIRFVPYHNVPGIKDPAGAPVPEADLVGQGEAWLLSDGQVVKGTWSKASATAPTTYVDAAGAPFLLAPGQTWVELAQP